MTKKRETKPPYTKMQVGTIHLADDDLVETEYIKPNGRACTVYVADMALELSDGTRRVLIIQPTKEEKDVGKVDILVTDDITIDVPSLLSEIHMGRIPHTPEGNDDLSGRRQVS